MEIPNLCSASPVFATAPPVEKTTGPASTVCPGLNTTAPPTNVGKTSRQIWPATIASMVHSHYEVVQPVPVDWIRARLSECDGFARFLQVSHSKMVGACSQNERVHHRMLPTSARSNRRSQTRRYLQ